MHAEQQHRREKGKSTNYAPKTYTIIWFEGQSVRCTNATLTFILSKNKSQCPDNEYFVKIY